MTARKIVHRLSVAVIYACLLALVYVTLWCAGDPAQWRATGVIAFVLTGAAVPATVTDDHDDLG